jgi:hypothetical protein
MTAVSAINAGGRITAAMLRGIAPLSAIKTVDETVTSSTALQNDDALFVSVAANASYLFQCNLIYEGGTLGSSDLKWAWTFPSGLTMTYDYMGITTAGLTTIGLVATQASTVAGGTNGAAALRSMLMYGSVVASSTAGTLQLQWAQNTSSGTGTIVHAKSSLALWDLT